MIQFASIVFSHASFESPQTPLVKKKVQLLMYRLIERLSAKMNTLDLASSKQLMPQERALYDEVYKLTMTLPDLNGELGALQQISC
jgi:hypothetical protein